MQTDYKNWVPKGMVKALALATCICAVFLFVLTTAVTVAPSAARWVGFGVFLMGFLACGASLLWAIVAYRVFSYTGKQQLSRHIINGIAGYVNLSDNAKGLDVGCGSGALTIACAKRNPKAHFTGVDRWGKEYADYSQALCFRNAMAEGMNNAFSVQETPTPCPLRTELLMRWSVMMSTITSPARISRPSCWRACGC